MFRGVDCPLEGVLQAAVERKVEVSGFQRSLGTAEATVLDLGRLCFSLLGVEADDSGWERDPDKREVRGGLHEATGDEGTGSFSVVVFVPRGD